MPERKQMHAAPPITRAAFQILLALADGEKHGYAIMQEIAGRTDGAVRLGPGTLYRTVKQLLAAGWIEERGDRSVEQAEDERRRYYCLSEQGRRVAAGEAAGMESTVRAAYAKHLIAAPGGQSR